MRRAALALVGLLAGCASINPFATPTGVLDAAWTAPTTNANGSALTDLKEYRVYYALAPNAPCSGTQFLRITSATASPTPNTTVTATLTGLTPGSTYNVVATAVNAAGREGGCSNLASGPARDSAQPVAPGVVSNVQLAFTAMAPPGPGPITFGETKVGTGSTSNLGGVFIGQTADLTTAGQLTTLSVYSPTGSVGRLQLAVFADAGGKPAARLAVTALTYVNAGWNAWPVQAPAALAAGKYWLVAAIESNGFTVTTTTPGGSTYWYGWPLGMTLPATPQGTYPWHLSLYGTVTVARR